MSSVVFDQGSDEDPVEVGADDAVLGRRRRQLLEARQLARRRLVHVLREPGLVDPRAQLGQLGLLLVTLAQLLLDRLQLLAEEELALALLHLRLHLRLDAAAELEQLELAVQEAQQLAQSLLDVLELEELLLLLGLDPQERGDEVDQGGRLVDVGERDLQLLREVRDEPDDALEERLDVARERFDLVGLDDDVGHLRELADEVRLVLDAAVEADALEPANEDAQRPVGNLDHLVDHGRRPDLVEIVPAGLLHVLCARGDEREDARLVRDDVVHEPDRAVLADRQRRQRAREHDRLLERENGECGRDLVLVRLALLDVEELFGFAHGLFTSIGTRPRGAGRGAIGNTILSRPCS